MKGKRTRDKAKHEAILKAAAKLFLKNGYTSTSMDAIAATARVTKQTVYSHYKSKDALFTHMVADLCERHTPQEALLPDAGGRPAGDLLYAVGLSFMNMMTSPAGLAATRLVISEANTHPKLAMRYYEGNTQRMTEMLSTLLDRLNQRGDFSIADTRSAASHFFALLKGRYYLRMLLNIKPVPEPREKTAHVKEVAAIFMKLYSGPNPLRTHSVL